MEIEQAFDDVTPGGRKVGKFQFILFSTATVVQVLLACQMCLMVVLQPILTKEDNPYLYLSVMDCSRASSIFQLGVLFGNLLIGPITDTKGRKIPFFLCVFLLLLIQVGGSVFHSSIVLFFGYRFLSGLLTGTLTVLVFVYGNEILPKSVWSMTGNVMPCVFALGIAGLALAGEILTTASSIILWTSLPFLIVFVPIIHATESPRFLLAKGQLDKAAAVFSTLAKHNGKIGISYFKKMIKLLLLRNQRYFGEMT